VDEQTRKIAGYVIAAAGAVIAFIGIFAREIGLGEGGFGPRQIAATVVGLVILAAGLVIALVLDIGGRPGEAAAAGMPADEMAPDEAAIDDAAIDEASADEGAD
jgi:hypothetical protein